jgi:adenine-specific DNA-methyltransferase
MSYERLRPVFTFDAERLEQLKAILPEAFADGKVRWGVLREALGDHIEDEELGAEHFGLSWPGKRDARRRASQPSKGTLVPVPGAGVNEETTRNIFIEADNLEALKLLQKSYAGRVKMIYIDPPYNTGNDFVYRDDFAEKREDYLRRTGQVDEAFKPLTSNSKADGRFHSNWLNMIYPRLLLARTLLRDDGVIFVSIDDNEIHNLRQVMDEVFGPENFVDCIIWKRRYGGGAKEKHLVTVHEYILFYAKSIDFLDAIYMPISDEFVEKYYKSRDEKYETRGPYRTQPLEAAKSMAERKNLVYPVPAPDGTEVWPKRQWLWSKERAMQALENDELEFSHTGNGWSINIKQYLRDKSGDQRVSKIFSIIDDVFSQHGTKEVSDLLGNAQIFLFPKPIGLIKPLLHIGTSPTEEDIVLDFFAGSGTTAHAILEQNCEDGGNRRFILVQFPEATPSDSEAYKAGYETISQITQERIRQAISKILDENQGKFPQTNASDLGFKSFNYSASNYKPWEDYVGEDVATVQQRFSAFEVPLIDGWREDDLLVEVMLLQGFPLDSRIETLSGFSANTVRQITSDFHAHSLTACLDAKIADATLNELTLASDDVFVCLDSALTDESKFRLRDRCTLRVI